MFLIELFTTFIYQPFFNILILMYWILGFFAENAPDMGVAVILLTIFIRFLLLPFSLAGTRSENERREIAHKVKELEVEFKNDPESFKKARKKVFSRNRGVLVSEMFSLFVQISISLMLWKMFETGLKGDDFHLIYSFMPEVEQPFNLFFMGRFELSEPSLLLNLVLSLMIFIFETISVLTSPYPPTRDEIVRLQLTLPVVSFLIFARLPAGKLLFVIVTLIFSIILAILKFIYYRFMAFKAKVDEKEQQAEDKEHDGFTIKPV